MNFPLTDKLSSLLSQQRQRELELLRAERRVLTARIKVKAFCESIALNARAAWEPKPKAEPLLPVVIGPLVAPRGKGIFFSPP